VFAWSVLDLLLRNWAMVAIGTTIAVLAVVPALVLLRYVRIALNIMRSTKPPLSRSPLDFERLIGEPVSFRAWDGLQLRGMIIRTDAPVPRGLIIFAHEYCSDMHSCARYCRPLHHAGYDILTFDFRGHGQSADEPGYTPRQWLTERELYDIRGAVAFAQDWLGQQGRPTRVGAVGISRGACAAIAAAEENPDIAALICDGAFCTDWTIEYFLKRWASIFASVRLVDENQYPLFWRLLRWVMIRFASRTFRCRFPSVRKAILRMKPRPVQFIHGERDSYLPVEQSLHLYALAPQPKSLWIAPSAKHNQAAVLHPERYAQMILSFLDLHLAGIPRPRSHPLLSEKGCAGQRQAARIAAEHANIL
jgi:pimeloyl-ACP methyl ester carboxylesterase